MELFQATGTGRTNIPKKKKREKWQNGNDYDDGTQICLTRKDYLKTAPNSAFEHFYLKLPAGVIAVSPASWDSLSDMQEMRFKCDLSLPPGNLITRGFSYNNPHHFD
ncbi:MAG TPA: hypothetical protein V6C86_19405 [Oculatellaceae cyanobacterium]